MYDGKQVLRFANKFKASDLGGLGIELTNRKGTGNYDKERTQFNYSYVPLTMPSLKTQVYYKLKNQNIYYNEGKNTNLLNGAIITSGKEFFQSLGMKFKDSGRTHQVGENKGKPILVPDIKSNDDIPDKVKEFFNESYKFLENLVGKENIVYAEIHYDEDTPHMHFYFLPVVNEVKRKVFEKDKDGNLIKHKVIGKDGNTKLLPIQKKDANGKNMFEIEKGKFLNCDQFWKELGGKASYAKIQDKYNEFITSKGFNLYRGNIGNNIEHIDKATYTLNELQAQIDDMSLELAKNKELNEIELQVNKDIENINTDEILNPVKRKVIGYKDEDINNLIDYSKKLKKNDIKNTKNIKEKEAVIDTLSKKIDKLSLENEKLKDGRAIKERDSIIEKQNKLIKEKNSLISSLEEQVDNLKERVSYFINICVRVCKALAHKLGLHYEKDEDVDIDLIQYNAHNINRHYEHKKDEYDKSDDFEIDM